MTDTASFEETSGQEAPAVASLAEKRLAALAKGRATAAANRAARAAAPKGEPAPPVVRRSASTPEPLSKDPNADLEGLTDTDCANDCGDGYCVITGQNHCGHPHKGGIQAAHQMVPKIKQTYVRAKKMLAHLAVDRK
jgi:hypothetical protein